MNYKQQSGIVKRSRKTLAIALKLQLPGLLYVLSMQKARFIILRSTNAPSFVMPPVILLAGCVPSINFVAALKSPTFRLPHYHRMIAS